MTQSQFPAWQDISSAPKDGTRILLCNDDHVVETGCWVNSWWERWERTNKTTQKLVKDDASYWSGCCNPTHWMPLPKAPE